MQPSSGYKTFQGAHSSCLFSQCKDYSLRMPIFVATLHRLNNLRRWLQLSFWMDDVPNRLAPLPSMTPMLCMFVLQGGGHAVDLHCYLPVQLPLSVNWTILNIFQISDSFVFMALSFLFLLISLPKLLLHSFWLVVKCCSFSEKNLICTIEDSR